MIATTTSNDARTDPGVDKFERRRIELAESALATLGELGYARTSLREIAQNSPFSHGVVHYYFADKTELIVHCVRYYKAQCVHRYDEIVETTQTGAELRERFAAKLVESLLDDAAMHRLWYDLRSQSMFTAELREAVEAIDDSLATMVGRVLDRICELSGTAALVDHQTAYALLDGIFQQALLDQHAEKPAVLELLTSRTLQTLELLIPAAPAG